MDIKKLKATIQFAKANGYDIDEADQLLLETGNAEQMMIADESLWHGEIYLIGASDLCNVLNQMTYDDYGMLYRGNDNQKPAFESYANYVRNMYDLSSFSDEMLKIGFDLVADLFSDNESSGFNTPEGKYNHNI